MTARVVLYTRRGCHLCEEAAGALDRLVGPGGYEAVDVDALAPEASARYSVRVPVVEVDGREVAELQVDERTLAMALSAGRC